MSTDIRWKMERDDPPLYFACSSTHYTNLDFIQLLIENGANPNQQTVDGMIH